VPVYASLLRSVNVGGRSIAMARLREVYESLGFARVESCVQSGNVVFTTRLRRAEAIASMIESAIAEEFGLDVTVLVRTPEELDRIVSANPFLPGADRKALHVTFLAGTPVAHAVKAADTERFAPDRFAVKRRDIYLACPGGYGRTKLNNAYFERLFGTAATTRNWNTVEKLHAMTRAR